ncbi:MAG: NUDIX domain-containing protein [Gemmatimonadota bacterium]
MWFFTTIGFFSIVQKPGSEELTVRARAKGDLENLRNRYLPEMSETIGKAGTDYPWRATVAREAFAGALGRIVTDVTYGNFKDQVAKTQGKKRARAYHLVWSALLDLHDGDTVAPVVSKARPGTGAVVPKGEKLAYGGVVIRKNGDVLLREPANHFDGYVWTFPKGRPNPRESPEETALRETLEETGVRASVVAQIPGDFLGGTTVTRYFLMTEVAEGTELGAFEWETVSVRWVAMEEARRLIGLTTNERGRKRDLAVLEALIAPGKSGRG